MLLINIKIIYSINIKIYLKVGGNIKNYQIIEQLNYYNNLNQDLKSSKKSQNLNINYYKNLNNNFQSRD